MAGFGVAREALNQWDRLDSSNWQRYGVVAITNFTAGALAGAVGAVAGALPWAAELAVEGAVLGLVRTLADRVTGHSEAEPYDRTKWWKWWAGLGEEVILNILCCICCGFASYGLIHAVPVSQMIANTQTLEEVTDVIVIGIRAKVVTAAGEMLHRFSRNTFMHVISDMWEKSKPLRNLVELAFRYIRRALNSDPTHHQISLSNKHAIASLGVRRRRVLFQFSGANWYSSTMHLFHAQPKELETLNETKTIENALVHHEKVYSTSRSYTWNDSISQFQTREIWIWFSAYRWIAGTVPIKKYDYVKQRVGSQPTHW
eukprot:TRINITY_DN17261_c0_g2_i1.p1 TRINITY_DN17261_c0_g2~~TRINITY_DN17261_c0_g2_i1.p1  ORF type:complete len:315 (+),score=48.12 TRINITY_DN17261_c0_g2_i1:723-1667(+)